MVSDCIPSIYRLDQKSENSDSLASSETNLVNKSASLTNESGTQTLSSNDIMEIISELNKSSHSDDCGFYKCSLMRILCIELMTCLHKDVILNPLRSRFLEIISQCIGKCIGFVGTWAGVSTAHKDGNEPTEADISSSRSTPNSVSASSSASSNNAPSINAKSMSLSSMVPALLPDIMFIISDLSKFLFWMRNIFISDAQRKLTSSDNTKEFSDLLLKRCVDGDTLLDLLWGRIFVLIENECRLALQSVRGIAGKYRMTNKPPPDSVSSYISTIFQPAK